MQLLNKYPNSDYASILKGAESSQQRKDQQALAFLEEMTSDFEQGKIVETLLRLEEENVLYQETAFAPQLEVLKAKAMARLKGIVPYKESLGKIATNYPDTNESNQAKELLEKLKDVEKETFLPDGKTKSWKIVITDLPFEGREKIKIEIAENLKRISDKISISEDIYDAEQTWIVVHGLQNRSTADDIAQQLSEIVSKNKGNSFSIATENYRLLQIRKEKEKYLEFDKHQKK